MIENLETLGAIHDLGTMSMASHKLRISQSAVSKRISALEAQIGVRLTERTGRKVQLTPAGLRLLDRTAPLLAGLRDALSEKDQDESLSLKIGVSESILSSWGASLLAKIGQKGVIFQGSKLSAQPEIRVESHAHRSPLVYEKVESGLYDLGICAGQTETTTFLGSLVCASLGTEPMVLVSARSNMVPRSQGQPIQGLLSIEKQSATWRSIKADAVSRGLEPERELESFFSIAALARAEQGVGLIPLGVAKALGFADECIHRLRPELERPIGLVYRKSKLQRPAFAAVVDALKRMLPDFVPRF